MTRTEADGSERPREETIEVCPAKPLASVHVLRNMPSEGQYHRPYIVGKQTWLIQSIQVTKQANNNKNKPEGWGTTLSSVNIICYLKPPVFNKIIMRHAKTMTWKVLPVHEKKRKNGYRNCLWEYSVSYWTDKDFKASIINIFTGLKEALLKEIQGGRMITFHQRERNYKKEPYRNCGIEKNN